MCLLLLVLAVNLIGCESTRLRMDRLAKNAEIDQYEIVGKPYRHLVFHRREPEKRLFVFIEGDGTPWISGNTIASDPTPNNVLAFDLMLSTDARSLYVGRPCYFRLVDPECESTDWTHGRFSGRIVDSMASAIVHSGNPDETTQIVLIGYSGGGSLAMLLASRLPNVTAVVTVAGLIDTESWVDHHGYEPLLESLNPATMQIPKHIKQIHVVGGKDRIVPAIQTAEAIRKWENAEIWKYEGFDHRCCWKEEWSEIFRRVENLLH